eukprot:TRINITY_DN7316_c0_g2_i1.p1 TRINITY_DN7316_c0_g2~~TRINITY_DN7316_c0_g2_i1.p1  ORF type:complete len:743 (+),score=105.50 TRINITY_DN7316_c0_g2_i1:48-2231(+)
MALTIGLLLFLGVAAAHSTTVQSQSACHHAGSCPKMSAEGLSGSHGSVLLQSSVTSSKQPTEDESEHGRDDIWVPELQSRQRTGVAETETANRSSTLDGSISGKKSASSWDWNSQDYDCDGDGTTDCGQWDWGELRCKNSPTCGHHLKLGDHLLEHSCRCMKCFDVADTAASRAPLDTTMKQFFYGRWRNWNKLTDTCAPWLMPKNDDDVRSILQYAKANGYTVRPSGATHSAGGLVTDGNDRNVLAVSLAEYRAPSEWEYSLKETAPGEATVIVNAGWSPLQLYQKIRPLNYFLPTQTAGPVFQLGGLVANSVHGGNYQRGFLHQYVKSMRVMLHNGTQRVISDPGELRFWRNSYGLLGIITSLEFSLDHRPQFQSYYIKKQVDWDEENYWSFIKQDAHADLSDEVIPSGRAGDRKALMGQFFLNPYEAKNGKATMSAVVWRANENATEPGIPSAAPIDVNGAYTRKMNEQVIDEVLREQSVGGRAKNAFTSSAYSEVIRHWGGPKVFPLGLNTNDIFAPNAELMTSLGINGPGMLLHDNQGQMNDGFYANKVPNVVYAAYFLDPKLVWKAMNILVQSFEARKKDPVFAWNGPPELRFIKVTNDAVLNPVPPGIWAVCEFMGFPTGKSDQGWKAAFKSIQDEWQDKLGGKPHLAKFWGFGVDAAGLVEPYQANRACRIYTDAQKASFEEYRRQADPENLFAGGDAMKLLKQCEPESAAKLSAPLAA